MFLEFEDAPQQLWLGLLLMACITFLIGGFVFGKLNPDQTHRMPTWTRIAASITLVVAGLSGWLFSRSSAADGFAFAIAIGMTLGCLGDLFMARLIPVKAYILGGIASFGFGHVAYIVGLVTFGNRLALASGGIYWEVLIAWWFLGVIGWYLVVFRGHRRSPLHYAALLYALLLAATAGVATGLALHLSGFNWLAIGTALFLMSDLLLAAQLFNGLHFLMIGDVVWLLYGPAQILIVYSVASAFAHCTARVDCFA